MGTEQMAEFLIAKERAALERWRKGDPDGFLEMIAEEYTYFDPSVNTRVDNCEGIKDIYESVRGKINFGGFEIIDPKVQARGDIAVLTFNFKGYDLQGDTMIGESSHWHTTEVYRRFDTGWKLISTHWSFTRPQLVRSADLNALPGEPTPVRDIHIQPVSGKTAERIVELERAALDRWGNGDPSGFVEMAADDYTYFDPSLDKRLDGVEAFRRFMESIRGKVHIDRYEIINPRVQTDGITAILTFNFKSYRINEQGEARPGNRWHATEIYRTIEGSWKLISTHWSFAQSTILSLYRAGAFTSENR